MRDEEKIMEAHPLKELCERYILDHNFSESTINSYRIVFKKYINFLIEHDIEYAKTSDVIKYRENKRKKGYSSHYIYVHISALKGLYRYLRHNRSRFNLRDDYAYDIMMPIKNERIKYHIKKPILTIEQAKHMILHTKRNRTSIWQYRDHAIIYLMLTAGIRRYEIKEAKKEDFQIVHGECLLYIRHNNERTNDDFVKIAPGVNDAINDYLYMRKDDNPYLFVTTKNTSPNQHLSRTFFREMFRRVIKTCGLENMGITPHCLRHTAGVINLLRGGSLEQTRQLLRHKDIKSTIIYKEHIERMNDDSELQIEKFILGDKG